MTPEDRLRESIESAHMAGQDNQGADPSYYEARVYCDKSLPDVLSILEEVRGDERKRILKIIVDEISELSRKLKH